ncbi:Peroxin 13, N-terminal region-domain-containing protein [Parasitella parasitica]|nr:Peroxin 13, N-terminal region-domain-containing protein [Parasitella parasitica]
MPSPPKPWEINSGIAASTPVVSQSTAQPMTETATATTTTTTSSTPTVPNRPSTMGAMGLGGLGSSYGNSYGTSSYGMGGYGTSYGSSYGTGGYGSSYSSPYSRMGMGSLGSGYGTGYGSYGSYGGMNSYNRYGTSGYNRFGGGMYGPEGGPDEFGLTQRMESSTRATFDVIESIVGAFGGFAQMLDSTYMATHSSFMAMVGVAEQFGNLKHYLGGIFSIFALIRWMKRLLYRLTGRTPPPELYGPTEEERVNAVEGEEAEALQITENGEVTATAEAGEEQHQVARVSRKRPIIIFLALVTGLPYLVYKLIKRSNEYNRARQQRMMIPQYGGPPPELARVMHDFTAESPVELTIHRGEMIHVLSKVDPATGGPCDWWQGRTSNGTIGIFPANYVQIENPGF